MRLTPLIPLDLANVQIDAYDLAHSVISIPSSSQLASLRWGKVSDADMVKYLTAVYTFQIPRDAKIPRIGAAKEDGKGNTVERREHLVIRDLDLVPLLVEEKPDYFKDNPEAARLGRIVAHADYRFRPNGWDWQDPRHGYKQANGTPMSIGGIVQPVGANTELIELFDAKVEELMDYRCRDQNCYELVNISTAASHLRKGLAKQLVMWLFPFCNQQQVDYKLVASPMGRGLYKSCGFLEEGEGNKWAVEIDMGEWGGKGLHQHVYMRRIQAEATRLECKPPKIAVNRLPLGIDLIQRYLKADAENTLPDVMVQQMAEQGTSTFKNNLLGSEQIFTAEPKNIQAMLATQFSDFSLGIIRRNNFFPLLGNGIFTQDGKAWEYSRAIIRPQFAREQIQDLVLEETHVQNMMQAIQADPKSGWTEAIDLQTIFFRLTLDSATEFLFGESADSQLAGLPRRISVTKKKATARDEILFADAFDTSQKVIATRLRFADKYWLYNPARLRSANKICHEFIDHYVGIALRDKLDHAKLQNSSGTRRKEKYVFLEELAKDTKDPIELRSQLLNMLLAGRDTTASLLGWLFYLLARDKRRWEKLRGVVFDEFGTYENPSNITFASIKSCQYLQHTMNEVLRLFPIVPLNIRFATKDTTLPLDGGADGKSPIFVKNGQEAQYSVHVMQRRKDIWGEDADEFIPERWVGRKIGWSYLPFNGGPRICLGQQFALTEASYVAIRLLQRFDRIENMLPEDRPRHNFTLTNCSASVSVVRLHEATP